MTDEEKIIRVKTLEDFDRELARDGDEPLEVPAWIAPQQRTWSELVKRSELNHDTEVYRTCNWKRRRLLEEGVTLRCIRIDAELKSAVAQRSERARPRHVRSERSAVAGARVMTAPGVPPRETRPPSNCERRCNPGKSASA